LLAERPRGFAVGGANNLADGIRRWQAHIRTAGFCELTRQTGGRNRASQGAQNELARSP
jgi:hypothetical protein